MVAGSFDALRAYDDDRFSVRTLYESDRLKAALGFFEPGQFIPVHAPGSAVVVAPQRGTATVRDGDAERAIAPGDVVVVPAGEDRGVRAEDGRLETLLVTAPPPTDAEHEPVRRGLTDDVFDPRTRSG